MKSGEFEAFLKSAGNAYSSEETKFGTITTFTERGCTYSCLGYKDDPDLLQLRCQTDVAEAVQEKRLAEILLQLELEYPVVKLRAIGSGKNLGFEVSAEQFEPDAESVDRVFWRTIDLMRMVVNECYGRLQAAPDANVSDEPQDPEWTARIEDALRNGCPAPTESASISARLRASIGLVMLANKSTGSAFCIHATDKASFYVTNAHVVDGATDAIIYRQVPEYEKMFGSVVARGDVKDVDLAIVSVPTGNIATVTIHAAVVQADAPAGLAGYARVQIWAAETLGELTPSIHFGTVTAVNKSGSTIMHDALSRPGNSGGPLFDPLTGNVIGVERGGWEEEEEAIAIGAPVLTAFLLEHAAVFAPFVSATANTKRAVAKGSRAKTARN